MTFYREEKLSFSQMMAQVENNRRNMEMQAEKAKVAACHVGDVVRFADGPKQGCCGVIIDGTCVCENERCRLKYAIWLPSGHLCKGVDREAFRVAKNFVDCDKNNFPRIETCGDAWKFVESPATPPRRQRRSRIAKHDFLSSSSDSSSDEESFEFKRSRIDINGFFCDTK